MPKQIFNSSPEVRRFIKESGINEKFSVRYQSSPFGGDGLFFVTFPRPEGVSVMSAGSPGQATQFGSSDNGVFAGKLSSLQALLANTNARASAS